MSTKSPPGGAPWAITLFGEFALVNPEGAALSVNNRKVEGLLALLIVHRMSGVARTEAGAILWPSSPEENQRTNLRQTLHLVKDLLGEEALDANRENIRLNACFPLICDYPPSSAPKAAIFMPGHEGPWFDDVRLESQTKDDDVTAGFAQTAKWLAQYDPRGCLALFRVNRFLTRGIPFDLMLDLVQQACPDPEPTGWADYWRGVAEDNLETCAAHLNRSLRTAREIRDFDLGSEACLELGKVYSRMGATDAAARIVRLATSASKSAKSKLANYNVLRVNALVLSHLGEFDRGIQLLIESEHYLDTDFELSTAQCSRAFYEASAGHFEQASRTLEASRAGTIGNASDLFALTKLQIAASQDRSGAASELVDLSARFTAQGSTQLAVYSDELLAKIYLLEGDRPLASEYIVKARKGRRQARMAVTKIESRRLAVLSR